MLGSSSPYQQNRTTPYLSPPPPPPPPPPPVPPPLSASLLLVSSSLLSTLSFWLWPLPPFLGRRVDAYVRTQARKVLLSLPLAHGNAHPTSSCLLSSFRSLSVRRSSLLDRLCFPGLSVSLWSLLSSNLTPHERTQARNSWRCSDAARGPLSSPIPARNSPLAPSTSTSVVSSFSTSSSSDVLLLTLPPFSRCVRPLGVARGKSPLFADVAARTVWTDLSYGWLTSITGLRPSLFAIADACFLIQIVTNDPGSYQWPRFHAFFRRPHGSPVILVVRSFSQALPVFDRNERVSTICAKRHFYTLFVFIGMVGSIFGTFCYFIPGRLFWLLKCESVLIKDVSFVC